MEKIIFVCGKICSGKNYLIENDESLNKTGFEHIVVSGILAEIIDSNDREMLQDTKHLILEIGNKIIQKINKSNKDIIIINGLRQIQILIYLLEQFIASDIDFKWEIVWLECPTRIRKERFLNRDDDKDNVNLFEKYDKADEALGLQQMSDIFHDEWLEYINFIRHF